MTREAIYRRESSWAPGGRWEMTRKWKLWQHVDTDLLSACARCNEKHPNKWKKSHSFCLLDLMTDLMSWWSDLVGGSAPQLRNGNSVFTLSQRCSHSRRELRRCLPGGSGGWKSRTPEAKMTHWSSAVTWHDCFRIWNPFTLRSYAGAALHN